MVEIPLSEQGLESESLTYNECYQWWKTFIDMAYDLYDGDSMGRNSWRKVLHTKYGFRFSDSGSYIIFDDDDLAAHFLLKYSG